MYNKNIEGLPAKRAFIAFLAFVAHFLAFVAHLPSIAGVKVWKARTGFRLIKCLASMGMWLCMHKAKGAFPNMHSDRAQWTFGWFGKRKWIFGSY